MVQVALAGGLAQELAAQTAVWGSNAVPRQGLGVAHSAVSQCVPANPKYTTAKQVTATRRPSRHCPAAGLGGRSFRGSFEIGVGLMSGDKPQHEMRIEK